MRKRGREWDRKNRVRLVLAVLGGLLAVNLNIALFRMAKEPPEPSGTGEETSSGPSSNPIVFRPGGFVVFQTVPLLPRTNGVDGLLEVWRDRELLPRFPADRMHPELADPYVSIDVGKFKPAVLRWLKGREGRERARTVLGMTMACFDGQVDLYRDHRPVFQFDQFTRTEAYKATRTQWVEIKGGRLIPLPFYAEERKYGDPRLEMDWKIEPAPEGTGKELLAFSSALSPGRPGGEMTLKFIRYSYDGFRWVRKERVVRGRRIPGAPFPDRALFP